MIDLAAARAAHAEAVLALEHLAPINRVFGGMTYVLSAMDHMGALLDDAERHEDALDAEAEEIQANLANWATVVHKQHGKEGGDVAAHTLALAAVDAALLISRTARQIGERDERLAAVLADRDETGQRNVGLAAELGQARAGLAFAADHGQHDSERIIGCPGCIETVVNIAVDKAVREAAKRFGATEVIGLIPVLGELDPCAAHSCPRVLCECPAAKGGA